MTRLLYIEASPRKKRSHSIELATAFVSDLKQREPSLIVDMLDLWAEDLPSFDGDVLEAKYALLQGDAPAASHAQAWKRVTDVIERFSRADRYVISTPMWNFGIPYRLKHLIDVIAQPSLTYAPKRGQPYGEWGLLENKKAVVISARGGTYPAGTDLEGWDFQGRYLEHVLRFIGIKDAALVSVELTAIDKETLPVRLATARDELGKVATSFLH